VQKKRSINNFSGISALAMTQTFKANGKLLLSGEYFILDGAKGLALPAKFGQTLSVEPSEEKGISWKSLDHENKTWFEAVFSEQLEIISYSDAAIAKTLQNILLHCNLKRSGLRLTSKLEFPQNWGLGSSSTLISLLAQYTHIDPYELLAKSFGGSGYDIACAGADGAISYQLFKDGTRMVTPVHFEPSYRDHLFFVHLGKKQNSREGIEHYRKLALDKTPYVDEISDITDKIIKSRELDECCFYLETHENIISSALGLPKVKDIYFPDFPGTVKSLGAWGGDFILVASDEEEEMIFRYFREKGFSTILPFGKMIL
jgi:mevalonate kinase